MCLYLQFSSLPAAARDDPSARTEEGRRDFSHRRWFVEAGSSLAFFFFIIQLLEEIPTLLDKQVTLFPGK